MGQHGSAGMSNGYENGNYGSLSIPPPIHHLGFGIYLTTVKSIAKKFAGGFLRGMRIYYLDAPKMETINFGSTSRMMDWWINNGYDPDLAQKGEVGRYAATVKLTNQLKSKYDAVWYKGQGMYRLLDGDQVVVFDPSIIRQIDLSLSKGTDIGAKVVLKNDRIDKAFDGRIMGTPIPAGTRGIVVKKQSVVQLRAQYPNFWAKDANEYIFTVKFKPGGEVQVRDIDIEPLS